MPEAPRILAIDDNAELLDLYKAFLGDRYDVLTATGGEEGLDLMDETIDLVLLDRHMPGHSGDQVLSAIRDRGFDVPVIMLTGVDVDEEIVTMPCNDYLTKPITATELQTRIEAFLELWERDPEVREYGTLLAKRRVLESEMTRCECDSNGGLARLRDQIEDLRSRIDGAADNLEVPLQSESGSDRDSSDRPRAPPAR